MNQNQFEYFPMGDQRHTLDADTFEGAIREARVLNKLAGIQWAGLIGMAGDGEFLGWRILGIDPSGRIRLGQWNIRPEAPP